MSSPERDAVLDCLACDFIAATCGILSSYAQEKERRMMSLFGISDDDVEERANKLWEDMPPEEHERAEREREEWDSHEPS